MVLEQFIKDLEKELGDNPPLDEIYPLYPIHSMSVKCIPKNGFIFYWLDDKVHVKTKGEYLEVKDISYRDFLERYDTLEEVNADVVVNNQYHLFDEYRFNHVKSLPRLNEIDLSQDSLNARQFIESLESYNGSGLPMKFRTDSSKVVKSIPILKPGYYDGKTSYYKDGKLIIDIDKHKISMHPIDVMDILDQMIIDESDIKPLDYYMKIVVYDDGASDGVREVVRNMFDESYKLFIS